MIIETSMEIYIQLLNEGVDVWRPTQADALEDGLFKVLKSPDYDQADEEWEFPPGSIVRCEQKRSKTLERDILVAVRAA